MKNYFEIFGIKTQFIIEENNLKQKYYELSRSVHPDINDQQITELDPAELNKAYKVLSKFESRSQYILDINQISAHKDLKDPAFLMEMMELNEEIEDIKAIGEVEKKQEILERVNKWMTENQEEQKKLGLEWDNEGKEEILKSINVLKLKQKYFLRMRESLEN